MASSISYFDLPLLVQDKIIREHVPIFQKVFTLSEMPEFSDALESKHSWLNPSEPFFKFYDSLRLLKPGFYLGNKKEWDHGFFVSMNDDNISFVLCSINKSIMEKCCGDSKTLNFESSLLETAEFFTAFLDNYTFYDQEIISVYKTQYGNVIINYSTNTMRWFDGTDHTLEDNMCYIFSFGKRYILEIKNDNKIYLTCIFRGRYKITTETVEPIKLESFLIDKKEEHDKVAFQLDLKVIKNNNAVSINAKILNEYIHFVYLNRIVFKYFPELVSAYSEE